MGLTNDERSSLVELRLEKAKRFIAEAEQMLSMGLWAFGTYSCWYFRRIWYEWGCNLNCVKACS